MRKNNNLEVRKMIADRKLFYYEIADAIGISAYTFSVWLRKEMPEEKRKLVMDAIYNFTPTAEQESRLIM